MRICIWGHCLARWMNISGRSVADESPWLQNLVVGEDRLRREAVLEMAVVDPPHVLRPGVALPMAPLAACLVQHLIDHGSLPWLNE